MSPLPTALPPALPSELLEYVLRHQVYPTTLIICQPRATFLSSLLRSIPQVLPKPHAPTPIAASIPAAEADLEQEVNREANANDKGPLRRHPLLIPTLHQIATSRHINLVFIPTLSHLRAYLSMVPVEPKNIPPAQVVEKQGPKLGLLVVYGLLECHRHTSEWSAQGLGNSLAALVDAGSRTGRRIVLFEELAKDFLRTRGDEADIEEPREENTRRRYTKKIWEERVPMLNGNTKRAGFDSEGGGWSGRTVEAGRILARWFKFERGDWET